MKKPLTPEQEKAIRDLEKLLKERRSQKFMKYGHLYSKGCL